MGVGMFFLQRGSLESNSVPEFPDSALPEVTVCNVESPLVHVTVDPFETVRVSGSKNLPLLGVEDPGAIVTELPPDAALALLAILSDIVVALAVILPEDIVVLTCALATWN